MRLATALSAITLFALPSFAEAQHYQRHHGYSTHHRHYVPPRQHRPHHYNRHHGWNNDALAVGIGLGLLGGLIGGSIINQQPSYSYPQPNYNRPCYREVIGYDPVTGHTIARTICP